MYATVRRYEGVDTSRTDELTKKVNENLIPKLSKLPGFDGYFLIEAGHGVTVNRESFLLPVDTPDAIEVDDKGELRGDAANRAMLSMASVLAPLEASKIGIVFLDACRNSATDVGLGMTVRMVSLGQQTRSVPVIRGTGSMEVKPSPYSAGVFRAYATQLNNVASDGAGRNSPFTKALLPAKFTYVVVPVATNDPSAMPSP